MRTAILGSAGFVGRLFAVHLCAANVPVVGIDKAAQQPAVNFTPVLCDLEQLDAAAARSLFNADCILLCLPTRMALHLLPLLGESIRPDALLVDTLSIKSPFLSRSHYLPETTELLSINPLFAPDLGFYGQNVAAVRSRTGPRTEWFVDLLQTWGARVTNTTALQHDRMAAQVQSLTHAVLLAFGHALTQLNYDLQSAEQMMTPPHKALLSLLARILTANPEVYWEIQAANAEAEPARSMLTSSCRELQRVFDSGNSCEFDRLFVRLREVFGPELTKFADNARSMLVCGTESRAGPAFTPRSPRSGEKGYHAAAENIIAGQL